MEERFKHLRVRTCGLVFRQKKLLLVKLDAPTRKEPFWAPPGGGLETGESFLQAVRREVKEETHLDVFPKQVWFVNEFIQAPFHAIEFYIHCRWLSGQAQVGTDPESSKQRLLEIGWFAPNQLHELDIQPPWLSSEIKKALKQPQSHPRIFCHEQ